MNEIENLIVWIEDSISEAKLALNVSDNIRDKAWANGYIQALQSTLKFIQDTTPES